MKISKNWLNNYIVSEKSDADLVNDFTQLGLECTADKITSIDSNIVIGKVLECQKHPNADRLKVCKVDISDSEPLIIVCGAPNIKQDVFVPVAKIGSEIGKFKIKKTKIRDVVSNGMICSEKELGIGDNHEGIMILNDSFKVGQTLNSALNIKEDTIFDFDMTPNRGDCFSHLGIARELSIIENKKIKLSPPKFNTSDLSTSKNIKVDIKETDICNRYSCIVIKNVKVGESPLWLKQKLESIGQKSINHVVDLANFIMFDLGQPLHVFDLDKIKGSQIDIRLASKNEKIITLDSETRELTNEDIIISDSKGPIAIAGVIGGLNSHVDENTQNILIESAIFNPINIRRTSKKYDCSTEASKRFERGVDYKNVVYSIYKFSSLLKDISDCEIACDYIDEKSEEQPNYEILFDVVKCNNFLGTSLKSKEIKNIFNSLNMDCSKGIDSFKCSIPSYRNDLEREVDLFEEVARVYGYDKIPSELNFKFSSNSLIDDDNIIEDKVRVILSNNGFNEHYSNSLYSKVDTEFSNMEAVKIINPLSKDMEFVRNSLVPGMLKALSYNEKRECDFLKLYEIGSINISNSKKYNLSYEHRKLCLGYLGNRITSWNNKKAFDIYDIKGDISMLMHNLGINNISYKVDYNNDNSDFNISILINKHKVGEIISLNHRERKKYNLLNNVIICNIDLDELDKTYSQLTIMYNKIMSYPSINRDIAILVNKSINHEDIVNAIFEVSSSLLKDVNLFDIYNDKSLDDNTKSMAYSLKFQSSDRTLTIKEIDEEMILIINNLKAKLKAKKK